MTDPDNIVDRAYQMAYEEIYEITPYRYRCRECRGYGVLGGWYEPPYECDCRDEETKKVLKVAWDKRGEEG